MYYAEFDSEGVPLGFFLDEIHGQNIPKAAVQISDEDYQCFINERGKWLWKGGKRVAAPVEPVPPELVIGQLAGVVRKHLNTIARERGYDDMLSLCSYATSTNEVFAAEGRAGVAWRDAVWAKFNEISTALLADPKTAPTPKDLLGMMPSICWP
jgi:hypothetical protein